jgi:hypothetical protein
MANSLLCTVALSLFVGNWKFDVAVTYSQLKGLLHQSRNLHISVRIAIRLWTARPTHHDATPSTATTCVSSPNSPDLPRTHPALHGAHCRWKSGQGVTLSTHLYPVQKLRTRGAIPPTATRLHIEAHNFALRVTNFRFRDRLV